MNKSALLKKVAALMQRADTLQNKDDLSNLDLASIYKSLQELHNGIASSTEQELKTAKKISTNNVLAVEPKLYGKDNSIIKGSEYWYKLPIVNGAFALDMDRHVLLQQTLMQLSVGGSIDDTIGTLTAVAAEMSSIKMNDDFYVGNIVSWQQRITDAISLTNRLVRTDKPSEDIVLKCFALLCYRLKSFDEKSDKYVIDLTYDPHNDMDLENTMIDLVDAKYPYAFFFNSLFALLPNLRASLTQDLVSRYVNG